VGFEPTIPAFERAKTFHASDRVATVIVGTAVTTQNLIEQGIKRRLNLGNACYHSVQNLSSSHLLSKYVNIRTYKTIILPVVLYGHETRSLTLREEHRLRVFENRVLR
jgi:hypothetical protein